MPDYNVAKTSLCKIRRVALGTDQNPTSAADIIFKPNTLILPDGSSFLIDDSTIEGERIFIFGVENARWHLESASINFMDGTFDICSAQFVQLYSIHIDAGSNHEETNVQPIIFALLPRKTEATYKRLFQTIKNWAPKWKPNLIKIDFEVAAINALRSVNRTTKISGCNFHFMQCLWRKIQEIGLAREYRENEEIKRFCRMCGALSLIPLEFVVDGWLAIFGEAPESDKLRQFADYFIDQWLDNDKMNIDVWNVSKQRHRTNNVVEGWHRRMNKFVGRNTPNIYYLVGKLREEAIHSSFILKQIECGVPQNKRKRMYQKMDQKINEALNKLDQDGNILNCLRVLSYNQKFD